MHLRSLLFAFAALGWACQAGPNDVVETPDSGTPATTAPADDTEPVLESPVDESHDTDTDDVAADEGDSP